MNTRRIPTSRLGGEVVNEGVPPQGEQIPQCGQVSQGEQVPIANQGNELLVVPCTCIIRRDEISRFLTGVSDLVKPPCPTCGTRNNGKCLDSTSGCYGCGKNDHKVRDYPTIAAGGKEAKKALSEG
ncbi:hypothetical protein EJD97_014305 [Solanum chilense]|uniref:CCHC-type domain-containing protein n=1 Tax=Solanum chilense TaxID=4083 RepID=A0A6N2BBS1_SOLCI|nr:hypothetical protein EJD97_014305 [Solanum chilense]